MLPSVGFFGEIDCPFFRRAFCERPHCLYKHVKEEQTMFDTLHEPSVTGLTNTPIAINGTPVSKDPCLLELERINKEIETVKSEVEKERRRLSKYQTVHDVDCSSTRSRKVSPLPEVKDFNGNKPRFVLKRPTKPYFPAGKYVVDNSKPRTDLEYDPMSNFSADLRSSGSAAYKLKPEQKVKSGQGVKRIRDTSDDQKKPLSSEVTEESEEEGVLIIDVPLSPDKKKSRALKPPNITAKRAQEVLEKIQVAEVPPFVPVNPHVATVKLPEMSETQKVFKVDNTDDLQVSSVSVDQHNESEVSIVSVFDDLSKCLEDLRSESENVRYQEPEPTVENPCSPEPEQQPNAEASLQMDTDTNSPVKESVTSLMADSGLLEHELSFFGVQNDPFQRCEVSQVHNAASHPVLNHPPFPSSHQLATEGQMCEQQQAVQCMAQSYWSPSQSMPSVPYAQKMPQQTPMFAFTPPVPVSPANYLEQAASSAGVTRCQPCPPLHIPSTSPSHVAHGVTLSGVMEPAVIQQVDDVYLSSEEELNCSDVELDSDSDPTEECYRIFMEANKGQEEEEDEEEDEEEEGSTSITTVGNVHVATPEATVKPKAFPVQGKRVAHVSRFTEPAAKSKNQVIIPLREPQFPQQAVPSRIQQLQQRASMLTAALKGGQAFISSTNQRKLLTLVPPPTHHPTNHPAPMQNTCVNIIPLNHAFKVGNNLHIILPEGSYAVPINPVTTSGTSVIPITALERVMPVSHVPVPPQPAACIPAKPIPMKRKAKPRPEVSVKVPHDVRQRYINLFVEELLKTSGTVQEAVDKAVAEEKTVYDRSINKLKYLSVAVNALKKLKNQSIFSAKVQHETSDHMSRGKIPLNVRAVKGNADAALYESLKEHLLSEESRIENNYPLQHPERPGNAILYVDNKKGTTDPLKRICCRCGATYSVSQTGKHTRKEECTYHYGKGVENKVPGGVETRYSCCEGVVGTPGCQVVKLHVHDAVSMDGFVRTLPRPASEKSCPGIYCVDTEMCYTTHGLELARVSVVNSCMQVIYDTFVKPDHEVIDYNTRFSGIGEEDVTGARPSIRDVQETLLSILSADTILIGHSLDTDLCALKLLHGTVVDTSVVFPHRMGLPHKLTLHSLTADYLRRIIQESVGGHDTAEDAAACMELMLWKVKEDGKVKRW